METLNNAEYGRVKDIQCVFGVKRGILYRWIKEGRVKSVLVREPGNKQGIRLISMESVRDYITTLEKEQHATP